MPPPRFTRCFRSRHRLNAELRTAVPSPVVPWFGVPPLGGRSSTRFVSFATLTIFLAALITDANVNAGTIIGTVSAQGAEPPADTAGSSGGGSYESRRYKFLERVDYAALRDFVVHIDRVSLPAPADQPTPRAIITQRDGAFVPHILPVLAGTIVEWPNADEIFHNVFSVSDSCAFDLGLYRRGDAARETRFDLPGRVDVFCSIHTRMSCVVLVLPNPWFARTDERNRYAIRNVPAGTYRVRAWHERMPPRIVEVVVPESGEVTVDFVLTFSSVPPR
jgi:plastocyanin